MIRSVTVKSPDCLHIHCLHNERHGLETGAQVKFSEQQVIPALNEQPFLITDVDPNTFSIKIDTSKITSCECGGLVTECRADIIKKYNSLKAELDNPTITDQIIDFAKFGAGYLFLLATKALDAYKVKNGNFPSAWNLEEANQFIELAKQINQTSANKVDMDEDLLRAVAFTSRGSMVGLTAFLGGLLAQQALIGVTGKFTPLNQWVFVDVRELLGSTKEFDADNYRPTNSRSDSLRILIGNEGIKKLTNARAFMIGCGAIGCEMMKNYAMLGFGTGENALISVTDNDLIEKSNLNRQFLFRAKDIDQPKSLTAGKAVLGMHPDLKVQAFTTKAGKESEDKFTDEFFQKQDVIVNALDNLEARLYVDSRCVDNAKPLLESGTQGAKGHVQVILPYKTPNYGHDVDPPEDGFAYCTVKSFPGKIVHTIQWARERFNKNFQDIPSETTQFRQDCQAHGYWEKFLKADPRPSKLEMKKYLKLLTLQADTYEHCLELAKKKFISYFRNSILQLLYQYPPDHKEEDGRLFWTLPRRVPTPTEFDPNNEDHFNFVVHMAALYAFQFGIDKQLIKTDPTEIRKILDSIKIQEYQIKKDKVIVADEKATKEEVAEKKQEALKWNDGEFETAIGELQKGAAIPIKMFSDSFEKDVDANHHIDWITATSNIRASQYNIERADRLKTKKIAGKIIPAMATSTAAVAGLVSVELVKIMLGFTELERYRNAWNVNLALPTVVFSEPLAVKKTKLTDTIEITLWNKRWEFKNGNVALGQFMNYFKKEYNLKITAVTSGSSIHYAEFITPKSVVSHRMNQILGVDPEVKNFVDLVCTFETAEGKDVPTPPQIRYYTKKIES